MSSGGRYYPYQPAPPARSSRADHSTRVLPHPVSAAGGPPRARVPAAKARRSGWRRGRRTILSILVVLVLFAVGVGIYLETSLQRVNALHDYPGRPAAGAGTNWLIVGSDSREGLSEKDTERLVTGTTASASGKRTDTIMVAHLPDNDTPPTLVSLPRDSQVAVPGKGTQQINAAFSLGGPALLVETVEKATGLRINHYAEIGFGGFATIVDAIGGVPMCLDQEMHDTKTGITLPAGCQDLDGANALGFVRMRYSEATPRSDLDRVANQRAFMGALASEIASPATLLNPFDLFPLLGAVPDAAIIDSGDHLHHLARLGWALRGISSGGVVTTTVPVTSGSAERWHKNKSQQLFQALRTDSPVPDSVIYN